jgi:cell wall-associated NlpC family hydrolase
VVSAVARVAVALTGALLIPTGLVAVGAPTARATPVPPRVPGAAQVQQAKEAAKAKAAQVSAVQAALVAASARLDGARMVAAQAAEAYNAAGIKLATAEAAARLARANASGAATGYQKTRAEVGRLASQAYREGGSLSQVGAVLAPGGPQDVLDRAAMIENLGAERTRVMQRMDATRLVARLLQEQADDALRRQQAATVALATAHDRASSAAEAAAATVAATEKQQATLLVQLAALKHTSVALEQQRQEALADQPAARRGRSGGSAPGGSGGSGSGGPGSGGSGSVQPAPPRSTPGTVSDGEAAVAWAKRQLGLPYAWGGAGPNSYDCSGLTMRAWQYAGVALPHFAASQYEQSEKVPYSRMRAGDLIFYASDTGNPASIHHVAMYVGGGQMIEAPYTGARVRIVSVRRNRTMPWAARP